MSVVIATLTDRFIALCADKQTTNMKTGEINSNATTKIELWAPCIAIGWAGNFPLARLMLQAVKNVVLDAGCNTYSLEEIADLFAQAYYAAQDEYSDMPATVTAKFMVAGKLINGKLGVIQVTAGNGVSDVETIEAGSTPASLIFDPEDLSQEKCNQLLTKAILNTNHSKCANQHPIERAHRLAVQYISSRSKYVGHHSDYIFITQ